MDFMQMEIGVGVAVEAILIVVLLRVRAFRTMPAFFLYICWGLMSDVLLYAASHYWTALVYFRTYLVYLVLDSVMMFAVLVELAWSLLRPIRASLPKQAWMVIAGLIALAGLILWPVAGWTVPAHLNSAGMFLFRLQQTFAILRVVIFVGLAGFSHVLSIGWRDRELQLATGLGAYAILSLTGTVLHTHQMVGSQYHWLDLMVASSWVLVLIYWSVSFLGKEAERQEFTPQMREFLLAAAGTARSTRMVLLAARASEQRKNKKT